SFHQIVFGFVDENSRPQLWVLLRERNISAIMITTRALPGLAMKHESQQSLNLRFSGHQLKKHARQPDSFLREAATLLIRARHVIPSDAERCIDRFQDGIESLGQLLWLRNFEPDSAVANFCFGTHQALSHRLGRNQKGTSDAVGIESEDSLQHECGM